MPKVTNENVIGRIEGLAGKGYSKAAAGRELKPDRATVRKYWPEGGMTSMDNETKDKEVAETPKTEEGFTNIVERFTSIVKKFKIKNAELVADHCAKGNLEDLKDVELRMHEMGVHPSLTAQVLSFWADEIHQPVPRRLRQRMEKKSDAKTKESREKEAVEKYAVDSETGVIRLAKEGEKAVSLSEAQRLQRLVKEGSSRARGEGYRRQKGAGLHLGRAGYMDTKPQGQSRLRGICRVPDVPGFPQEG